MVWFVIVCMCQCTSHYWVPLHVRHQHSRDPSCSKAEIYCGRQYLSDGFNILVSGAGPSSSYGFWPSSITSSRSTVVGKFKLIYRHSTTHRFQPSNLRYSKNHTQCTDLCRGHSSPSFNHIDLLANYFIMNMVWFVIMCICQCTSHHWIPLHVRHQHYWDP